MFTREQYRFIAGIINRMALSPLGTSTQQRQMAREIAAYDMADNFARRDREDPTGVISPTFNRSVFLHQCGVLRRKVNITQ